MATVISPDRETDVILRDGSMVHVRPASPADEPVIGGRLFRNLIDGEFTGPAYPVNPAARLRLEGDMAAATGEEGSGQESRSPQERENVFKDRRDAGRQLGRRLSAYSSLRPVVIALPRGGVPVAAEVAAHLGAPLDVIVIRKIGLPWQPELALGAVAEGDVCVMNDALIEQTGVSGNELEAAIARERVELERRVRAYRGERSPLRLDGRIVIVVDDGLATGYTARAAIELIRRRGASRVVLAVPVAPEDSVATMGRVADEFVVLQRPAWFLSIGENYQDFRQTSDAEVVACLQRPANPAMGHVA